MLAPDLVGLELRTTTHCRELIMDIVLCIAMGAALIGLTVFIAICCYCAGVKEGLREAALTAQTNPLPSHLIRAHRKNELHENLRADAKALAQRIQRDLMDLPMLANLEVERFGEWLGETRYVGRKVSVTVITDGPR